MVGSGIIKAMRLYYDQQEKLLRRRLAHETDIIEKVEIIRTLRAIKGYRSSLTQFVLEPPKKPGVRLPLDLLPQSDKLRWEKHPFGINTDDDDEDWITVGGTHVLLGEGGVALSGGKLKGKTFSQAKSQKKAANPVRSAGRTGKVGGSAPGDCASSSDSLEKVRKAKDNFKEMDARAKSDFLEKTGVMSPQEAERLAARAEAGDTHAEDALQEAAEKYFSAAERGRSPKTLECPIRDEVAAMSDEEKREWVYQAVRDYDADEPDGLNRMSYAQKAVYMMGLTETPQMVSKEEFEKYVADTKVPVMYRGVDSLPDMSAQQMQFQMAYDTERPYIGHGNFGDGLYFGTTEATAEGYAYGGAVSKCVIRPDAKVADYGDPSFQASIRSLGIQEPSIAALCNGYDAVKVPGSVTGKEDMFIVLNKASLIMEDPADELQDKIAKAS